jgi:hypothetical protein
MASYEKITAAANGLYYLSETDHPFSVQVITPGGPVEAALIKLSGQPAGAPVEKITLQYFLRNMVKADPNGPAEEQEIAKRFQRLQQVLEQELSDVEVYRIGRVNIDAFIAGKTTDGNWLTLQTKLVET